MRVSSVGWVTEARGLVTECEAGGREQGSPGGREQRSRGRGNNWRKPFGAKPDKWSTT